jgi:hypothetical protein
VTENASDESLPWISVSDLAEYAYCPRAYWYRHHPPRERPAPEAVDASRRGEAFHQRTLTGVRRREEIGPLVGIGAVTGAVLVILILLVGGFL